MDIFLAGYPGLKAYGLPSECFILKNDGKGHFTDEGANEILPGGMAKDALWSDIDNDGRTDLIVVGYWMNISIFRNTESGFIDITGASGLEKTTGWWNTIKAGDLDDDGDIDFVAGNLGENAKIKAKPDEPVTLYLSDFDSDGRIDPMINTSLNGKNYIFPTRDQLFKQIPSLKNHFPTYTSFAEAGTVESVFTAAQLENARIIHATEFRTCLIENNGDGTFTVKPLPAESQLFPVNSILLYDADRDGKKDIILAGNMFEAHIEYGRYDAGYGLFIKNNGNNDFKAQTIRQSGILIRGEVRDMALVETQSTPLIFIGKNNGSWQVLAIGNGR